MRFFFDYTNEDKSLLDYRGDEFHTPQCAIDFARTTAQFLKNSMSADWLGWSVEVRNAEGLKYCSVPVDKAGAVAA
jgi:hypothetical protein